MRSEASEECPSGFLGGRVGEVGSDAEDQLTDRFNQRLVS